MILIPRHALRLKCIYRGIPFELFTVPFHDLRADVDPVSGNLLRELSMRLNEDWVAAVDAVDIFPTIRYL